MSAWEQQFLQNVPVPPHGQRGPRGPAAARALQCVLKRVEGAAFAQVEGPSPRAYQLRLTLFDVAYRHFFGRTWRSRRRPLRTEPRQPPGAVFNETVYFHTSLDHPSITAVVEVVAIVKKQDGISQDLSCGFGIIHLFNSKLKLYHGTPRALLHPLFQDPVEKNKYMTVMENSHLQYTLRPHAPLETIAHLFPENLLMSGLQRIPGVLPARGHTGERHTGRPRRGHRGAAPARRRPQRLGLRGGAAGGRAGARGGGGPGTPRGPRLPSQVSAARRARRCPRSCSRPRRPARTCSQALPSSRSRAAV
uniref:Nephrocystin 4 n=1 Tax=Nothoprocta perdicaria TaxID=30464 RepID=A0A8C6YZW0_NOTPE